MVDLEQVVLNWYPTAVPISGFCLEPDLNLPRFLALVRSCRLRWSSMLPADRFIRGSRRLTAPGSVGAATGTERVLQAWPRRVRHLAPQPSLGRACGRRPRPSARARQSARRPAFGSAPSTNEQNAIKRSLPVMRAAARASSASASVRLSGRIHDTLQLFSRYRNIGFFISLFCKSVPDPRNITLGIFTCAQFDLGGLGQYGQTTDKRFIFVRVAIPRRQLKPLGQARN